MDIMTGYIDKEKVTFSRALPATLTRTIPTNAVTRLAQAALRSVKRALLRAAVERELTRLDDRMLADIGVQRWDIAAIADRAATESFGAPAFRSEFGRVVREAFGGWYSRQIAYRDLMALDDRMLRDIGISRADIPAVIARMRQDAKRAVPVDAAADIIQPLRHWNRSRLAAKDLNTLDDRTLDDIGMVRGDIVSVADELARRSLGVANGNSAPRAA